MKKQTKVIRQIRIIRKTSILLCMIVAVGALYGCGGKKNTDTADENIESNTIAGALYADFKTAISDADSIDAVANTLIKNEKLQEVSMTTAPVSEGYLPGFQSEIKGFTSGVTFAPMIGTIPLVGYIFETDDTEALVSTLKENADLNWNICTQADEMIVEAVDQYVFFVMAPNSFEDNE